MSTPHHARYIAHELSRQSADNGVERLSRSLFDACVDLNPHQIEAALFALRSPISKGVLLADEVGLGKTIEAGLALCQHWAEGKRKLLVICPASLRKQWATELWEKFSLPCRILDAKLYRESKRAGSLNPFDAKEVVICSIHFAARYAGEIKAVPFSLVCVDEAHKLRNTYRQSNRMGQQIRWALEDRRKILLTATPLQNSLLELYGLTSLIDEYIFGDLPSFRTQYCNAGGDLDGLRNRLKSFCHRTLRSQVMEYVSYTERRSLTVPFTPTENEHELYNAVSAFIQREDTYALPSRQKHLTTLIIRKLLASSSQALAGTLEAIRERLIRMKEEQKSQPSLFDSLINDEELPQELLDDLLDEVDESEAEEDYDENPEALDDEKIDLKRLEEELEQVTRFAQWARSIGIDTKTRALLTALNTGFEEMKKAGAADKAVIFTESRRTQRYIKDFLDANGFAGKVVTFNGSNTEPESRSIYEQWIERHRSTGRASGSRPVDTRTALIDYFREEGRILVATEAAAEGINLQFCSLVINFDLPWNPQRIEQRIGRCHRYGQKHDVVVINFLNEKNEADQRVFELLRDKYNLFQGVFGASDEILGTVESGVDFERRIFDIYQECRTSEEIESAFQALREQLDESIKTRIASTRTMLLENFDEDVHERLKWSLDDSRHHIDRISRLFWTLTKVILRDKAGFDDDHHTFDLHTPPFDSIKPGTYRLIAKDRENVPGEFLYRLTHPLGEMVIEAGRALETPSAELVFDISNRPTKLTLVEQLKGCSGWLHLAWLSIQSFAQEDYLLFSAMKDDGTTLDQETCEKLFQCDAHVRGTTNPGEETAAKLHALADRRLSATLHRSLESNNKHFQEACAQLEKWADDMVKAAEKELETTKEQIKALSREARVAESVEQQHATQKRIEELEKSKRRQRQRIFEAEDEIHDKRERLVKALEDRMKQRTTTKHLFTIRWTVK